MQCKEIIQVIEATFPRTAALGFDNVGLLAGPWFEGKMTSCLVDILRCAGQFGDMLILVLSSHL